LRCVAVCRSALRCVTVRNAHILPAAVDKSNALQCVAVRVLQRFRQSYE